MRLFTLLDCNHFRACSPAEVGQAWVPRWTVDDLDAGLCTYRDLGKDKPPPADAAPPPPANDVTRPQPFSGGVPLLRPDNIANFRQAQIEELWAAAFALRPAVLAGDRQAADSFVKIHDRLAKLSGTDAPKQNVNYIGTNIARLSDEELERIASGGLTLIPNADGTYSEDGQ